MTNLNWRVSQRMRKTFLADLPNGLSVILFRSLEQRWVWAVRDMSVTPMRIIVEGQHRNRTQAAADAAKAVPSAQLKAIPND